MKCRILYQLFALIVFHIPTESFSDSSGSTNRIKKGLYLCDGLWSTEECKNPESVLPYKKRSSPEIQKQSMKERSDTELRHHERQFQGGEMRMHDSYFSSSSQKQAGPEKSLQKLNMNILLL
jgi:hypothetical protein